MTKKFLIAKFDCSIFGCESFEISPFTEDPSKTKGFKVAMKNNCIHFFIIHVKSISKGQTLGNKELFFDVQNTHFWLLFLESFQVKSLFLEQSDDFDLY